MYESRIRLPFVMGMNKYQRPCPKPTVRVVMVMVMVMMRWCHNTPGHGIKAARDKTRLAFHKGVYSTCQNTMLASLVPLGF